LAQPAGGILGNFAQRVGGNLGSPSPVIANPRADQWTSVASPIESNTTTVPNWPPSQGRLTPLLTQAQFQLRDQNEPVPVARKKINEAECLAQYKLDTFHCNMVGLSQCYAQAMERLSACLAGRPIPPFNY
jgi:hypothetical protein